MSARAPQAIYKLWYDIQKAVPRAVLSGIVGDVAHSFGYHLARHDLPQSDYSVQLGLDRLGASDCASALDVSLPPDLMKTCTKRLYDAARAGDPRLKGLREFCGTLDGTRTFPWDLNAHASEGVGTWDDSHLWHIHLSFYRACADQYDVIAPIAQVFAGIPAESEFTVDAAAKARFDKLDAEVAAVKAAADDFPKTIVSRIDGKTYPLDDFLQSTDQRSWQMQQAFSALADALLSADKAATVKAALHSTKVTQ